VSVPEWVPEWVQVSVPEWAQASVPACLAKTSTGSRIV
jgi:hypothetical protein